MRLALCIKFHRDIAPDWFRSPLHFPRSFVYVPTGFMSADNRKDGDDNPLLLEIGTEMTERRSETGASAG